MCVCVCVSLSLSLSFSLSLYIYIYLSIYSSPLWVLNVPATAWTGFFLILVSRSHAKNIYIYIYIYIYCHQQTHWFIVSQLFSVARRIKRFKLGLKPAQLYAQPPVGIRQLGNYKALCCSFRLFTFYLTGYPSAR